MTIKKTESSRNPTLFDCLRIDETTTPSKQYPPMSPLAKGGIKERSGGEQAHGR